MTLHRKNKIVIIIWGFCPPGQNGGQNRIMGIIQALVKGDWKVYLLMLNNIDFTERLNAIKTWKSIGVYSVQSRLIYKFDYYLGKIVQYFSKALQTMAAIRSPLLRNWIHQQLLQIDPSIVLTNLVEWSSLVSLAKGKHLVIDCVDIWSRHKAYYDATASRFPWVGWSFPSPEDPYLDESFFDNGKDLDLKNEMQALATFDTILTISSDEAEEIRKSVDCEYIETIPMCVKAVDVSNTHLGPPIMVGHNHPFNAQAYAYFVQRILPFVLVSEPLFSFRVIGKDTKNFPPNSASNIIGFVDNIAEEYRNAAFMVVPVLGGTGQLTRVVEAMGHGLPVVATRSAARSSPIKHGINGYIADNAKQFAQYVIILYNNRDLAASMGRAALATIRSEYSLKHLHHKLDSIFTRS